MNTELFILLLSITLLALAELPRRYYTFAPRLPHFRAPNWLRIWQAARVRQVCHERADCDCDIFILSDDAALYVCNTHGLVRLITEEKKVEELIHLLRRSRQEGC